MLLYIPLHFRFARLEHSAINICVSYVYKYVPFHGVLSGRMVRSGKVSSSRGGDGRRIISTDWLLKLFSDFLQFRWTPVLLCAVGMYPIYKRAKYGRYVRIIFYDNTNWYMGIFR